MNNYIVQLLFEGENLFFVWQQEKGQNDEDHLLNEGDCFVLFGNLDLLTQYCKANDIGIADANGIFFIDIDHAISQLHKTVDIDSLSVDVSCVIVDFINIVGDFAYQTNNPVLTELYENAFVSSFKEIYLNNNIWGGKDVLASEDFDFEKFTVVFEGLINGFLKKGITHPSGNQTN